ncbi:AAA family ATPase [Archaeoglobus sp.]
MYIEEIAVKNFKSFGDMRVKLGKFNVLIGANASGKSNFVDLLRFIKNLILHGLEDAFQMMGGVGFVRNLKIGSKEPIDIAFTLKLNAKTKIFGFDMYVDRVAYRLGVKANRRLSIVEDRMIIHAKDERKTFRLEFFRENGRLEYNIEPNKVEKKFKMRLDGVVKFISEVFPREPIVRTLMAIPPPPILAHNIGIYNFDPKEMKSAVKMTGKAELEEDGSNLPIILQKSLSSKENRINIVYLLKDFVSFVEDVKIERLIDKSVFLSLKEEFYDKSIPASLISDGTLNILATILALVHEKKSIYVFEEPERNVHPTLIEKLVNMFKEFSERKQIILTTHNPLIVKYAEIENILLVKRDDDGFSHIVKPKDSVIVKEFLKSDFGLDELFVKGLIGAGV